MWEKGDLMSVIRVRHDKNNSYITINKSIAIDPNLRNCAKGLWFYCMSRPDDWDFYICEMVKNCQDGKDAVYSQCDELIKNGYAARFIIRRKNGTMESMFFEVYEVKQTTEMVHQRLQELKQENSLIELYTSPRKPRNIKVKQTKSKPQKTKPKDKKYPDRENPDLVNPPLLIKDNIASKEVINYSPPKSQQPDPKIEPKPDEQILTNNFFIYDFLKDLPNLSDQQKITLSKLPEAEVRFAVEYVYHPETVLTGENCYIKQLKAVIKNPENYREIVTRRKNPEQKLSPIQQKALQYNEILRKINPKMAAENDSLIPEHQLFVAEVVNGKPGRMSVSLKNPESLADMNKSIQLINKNTKNLK